MTKDEILSEILKKYRSQKACAKALGMSEQAFSHALSRLSDRFIKRLAGVGISLYEQEKNLSPSESELQNLVSKLVKENFELKEENANLKILVTSGAKKNPNKSVR